MDFWLLDNPNPNGPHYYPSRRLCRHGITSPHLIVLHTAENLPDFDPPDLGAEKVAEYASTTTRRVSWHYTVDSDSIIPMMPLGYTAWHVRDYNRCSVGLELATRHDRWVTAPKPWRHAIYNRCADTLVKISTETGIPFIDRREHPEKWGVTTHQTLDPDRRQDPGVAFPFSWILEMAKTGYRYHETVPVPVLTLEQRIERLEDRVRQLEAFHTV